VRSVCSGTGGGGGTLTRWTSECAQMTARESACGVGLCARFAVACGLMDARKSVPRGSLELSPV
jgi:hypothetical protein